MSCRPGKRLFGNAHLQFALCTSARAVSISTGTHQGARDHTEICTKSSGDDIWYDNKDNPKEFVLVWTDFTDDKWIAGVNTPAQSKQNLRSLAN